jgi:hypothetical protein
MYGALTQVVQPPRAGNAAAERPEVNVNDNSRQVHRASSIRVSAAASQSIMTMILYAESMTSSDAGSFRSIFFFQCQHHMDGLISEQARIALPVCVVH